MSTQGDISDYKRQVNLSPIVLNMSAQVKRDVTEELANALVEHGCLAADLRDQIRAEVHAREEVGCTALANGIAVPHCRTELLDNLCVAIGIHPVGIDCGSIDGLPSRIFILVVAPLKHQMDHIRFLAEINRRLLMPEIRERVLLATSADAVRELLLTDVSADFC